MINSLSRKGKFLFLFTILLVVLTGYRISHENSETVTIGNPTPKDFLEESNADIFLFDNIVYSNVDNLDWVKDLNYSIGEEIGEITKQTKKANHYKNGTSNKLPVGTKIYKTDTQIYIAIVDGKEIPYLKMLEG